MKRKVALVLIVLLLGLVTPLVFAEKKVVTLDDFENTVYKSGDLTLNNFTIFEDSGWMTPTGWNNLNIKLSGKNNRSDALSIGLQFAGLNQEGEVIWAMNASPMMGILSENSLEEISGSILVKPGTLNQTEKLVIFFSGEI